MERRVCEKCAGWKWKEQEHRHRQTKYVAKQAAREAARKYQSAEIALVWVMEIRKDLSSAGQGQQMRQSHIVPWGVIFMILTDFRAQFEAFQKHLYNVLTFPGGHVCFACLSLTPVVRDGLEAPDRGVIAHAKRFADLPFGAPMHDEPLDLSAKFFHGVMCQRSILMVVG